MQRFLFILILFSLSGFSGQYLLFAQALPYPIIFVHGLNSNDKTWEDTIEFMRDNFGWDDPYQSDTDGTLNRGVYHIILNAYKEMSNIAGSDAALGNLDDDVLFLIFDDKGNRVNKLYDGNIFAINFQNFWNEKPNAALIKVHDSSSPGLLLGESSSNESAITKQGYALGRMIKQVLNSTGAQKIILVCHSMGGLAAREYLQRIDANGKPKWWAYPEENTTGHRVAKLVTIGTPHWGSNATDWAAIITINPNSEASRDLHYHYESSYEAGEDTDIGVYLFGGSETRQELLAENYHNNDIDCDGDANDLIVGLNSSTILWFDNRQMPLPPAVVYTWIASDHGNSEGDKAVRLSRQFLRSKGDTLQTNKLHWDETADYRSIIRGLDEPENLSLAYEIATNRKYQAFTDIPPYKQGYSTIVDRDAFFFQIEQTESIEIQLGSLPFSNTDATTIVQIFDQMNDLSSPVASATNQAGTRSLKLAKADLTPGIYYVRTTIAVDANSWRTPYTVEVKTLSAPTNLLTYSDQNALPANGATATVYAELRMSDGSHHPTATNPVTFTITSGAASAQITSTNPVNAVNGVATATLQSTTTPGLVTIEASASGLTSSTTTVNVFASTTPVSGTIRSNTTWALADSPYEVTGDVTVAQGVTLTIEPGVTVRFNPERDIYVDGALIANGTAAQQIVFTANSSTPFAGFWGGIKFNNSSISHLSVLNYCQFLYAGQNFRSEDAPIVLNAQTTPTITNTRLINNKRNGIHLVEGTYRANIHLAANDLPYFITDSDITIAASYTMTIDPGVTLKFGSERDLYIDGALVADGTPTQPIVFTSFADDAHGGDTNGDGQTFPEKGNWGGIKFNSSNLGSTSILDNCQLYFAGQGFRSEASPLTIHGTITPRITQTTLANNTRNGIRLVEGTYNNPASLDVVGIPYFIESGDVVMASGVKMTIRPGVIIKFGSERDIHINGALEAKGTASQPIIFTSMRDDTHGGDTNGDGPTSPEAGNWGGIRFNDSSIDDQSALEYCEFYYGGQNFRSEASPITINGRVNPDVIQTTLASNRRNGVRLLDGTYNASVVLDVVGIPYFIETGDIVMASGAKMTIQPGVVVKFGSERDFYINGALHAKGTADEPIIFTSLRDDARGGDTNDDGVTAPEAGNWGGIRLNNSNIGQQTVLEYCEFYYGGQGFRSEQSPLTVDPRIRPDMKNLRLANNHNNGIDIIDGSFNAHLFLETTAAPYTLRLGDMTISQGVNLTVGPGVIVKFGSERDLHIRGALIANGTAESPIIFTSMNDDAHGGNTNNKDESVGLPGDWGGIKFYDTSDDQQSELGHCQILFGGQGFRSESSPLVFENASPKIENTTIRAAKSHGVFCIGTASPDFGGGQLNSIGKNRFLGFIEATNKYAFFNDGTANISAKHNDWETSDFVVIEQNIYDFFDNAAKGEVIFDPIGDFPTAVHAFNLLATVLSGAVELSWPSDDEGGVSGYVIERSNDGLHFAAVDSVHTPVVRNRADRMRYLDRNLAAGTYYYRIHSLDEKGRVLYSEVVQVNMLPPTAFSLSQNYPNPFNPRTHLNFALPKSSHVQILIYNSNGRLIKTLVDDHLPAGNHRREWDGANELNQPVPSGVYLLRMISGKLTFTRKMLVIR